MSLRARWPALMERGTHALSWWWDEVERALPMRWREAIVASRPTTYLTVSTGGLLVETGYREVDAFVADDDPRGSAWIDTLIGSTRTHLLLDTAQVLVIDLSLPCKIEGRLDEAIGWQLAARTPVDLAQLEWTYRILARSKDHLKIRCWCARSANISAKIEALPTDDAPAVSVLTDRGPVILRRGVDGSRRSGWYRSRRNYALGALFLFFAPLTATIALDLQQRLLSRDLDRLALATADIRGAQRRHDADREAIARMRTLLSIPTISATLTNEPPAALLSVRTIAGEGAPTVVGEAEPGLVVSNWTVINRLPQPDGTELVTIERAP